MTATATCVSTGKRYRRGLVVGKFSPLHLGHEHLIRSAEAVCDETLVISYSRPELAPATREVRERWLQARHPDVQTLVIDDARLAALCAARGLPTRPLPHNDDSGDEHRAFVGWLLLDLLGTTVDAVFSSEDYGDGFAASLAQQFRARDPGHAGVAHVLVDRARTAVPVSGTAVRGDARAHRHLVAPEVWADLVPRVCLLGAESSGKTTLAAALAARLGTTWVAEYGRERWLELHGADDGDGGSDGALSIDELVRIGRTQVEREVAAAQHATGWLVCDTSPLTTLVYALLDHGDAPAELHELARRRYDLVVVCTPDFAFVQDGSRRDRAFQQRQQALTLSLLTAMTERPLVVTGTVAQRLGQVTDALGEIARR